MKRRISILLAVVMLFGGVLTEPAGAKAAKSPKLSAKKVMMTQGKEKTITLKNVKKK